MMGDSPFLYIFLFLLLFFFWHFLIVGGEVYFRNLCIYSAGGAFALPLGYREEAEAGSAEVQPARNISG
jgi:hypothetical protein